ncbi:beta-glucosidase [Demequina lutea]|uniref:Exo-alpha-(1->6)-L-arabinopyranosidase n=1 Tax=Demequina lutea TaxID=431489 RepID=A0A7Y9Z7T7_9MICO|nr:glycoside hydrolase family 3 C-terminal domain-containing protein [Demequina lutea]NYI40206.1 beta-glucosidase [Demequina lutea]
MTVTERERRAVGIVAELDLATKVRLLSGRDFWTTEPLPEHDVPSVMMTDGPHGLRKQDASSDNIGMFASVPATCFPTASALASTWSPALAEEVGVALGRECVTADVALLLGPGLNIKRHPAGGRNFEYFSEDPLISGRMAGAMVRGIQGQGVGACLKHYAVNSQESDRFRVDTIVDERTLRELYLTGFEIAARESRPWAVMSSYNRVNGEHVGESVRLAREKLRTEFGFDGLLISDWLAVSDRVAGVRAGLDLEMPSSHGTWDTQVIDAVRSDALDESLVDEACARVIGFALRAGEAREARAADADEAHPLDLDSHHADPHQAATHHDLARRVAAASTVLLTNNGTLPLDSADGLAVIGAFARTPRFQGAGSSLVNATRVTTALDACAERGAEVTFALGYDASTGETNDALVADAVAAATGASAVLLMVGLPATSETEGLDRTHLDLPQGQVRLIEAVAAANPRTIVAVSAGAPVHMDWAELPAAVLLSYLGGQASGEALIDIILGAAEPSGRLAESIPTRVEDLPSHANFATHPTQVEHREALNVGYRFHDTWGVPARFAFGHGLGYATFEFGAPRAALTGRAATVTVPVTNTGKRAGTAVVQVYVHALASAIQRPAQELKGFASLTLEPGETATTTVELDERAFAVYDASSARWAVEAGDYEIRVSASSVDVRGTTVVSIKSGDRLTPMPFLAGPVASDAEWEALLGRPAPTPRPLLPFNRESTVADLLLTWAGRLLRQQLLRAISKAMGVDTDDVNQTTADAYADGISLRGIAAGSEGRVTLRGLGAIIGTLNVLAGPRAWRRLP